MVKDCPKCGLVNPPEAQQCDCGYDFVKRKIEQAHLRQGLPEGPKTFVLVISLVNLMAGVTLALNYKDPTLVVVAMCCAVVMWLLYWLVVMKHFAAYIGLTLITLPIGLGLLHYLREVRRYCVQK